MQAAEFDDDELLLGTPSHTSAPPAAAAKRERSPPTQAAETPAAMSTNTAGGSAAGVFSFQGGNGLSKMSALAFGKPKPSSILNNNGDEAQRKSKQPRVCLETVLANAKKNATQESASPLRTTATTQQSQSTTPASMVKPSTQQPSSSSVTPIPSSATPTCGGSTVMGTYGGAAASTPQPSDHSAHPAKTIVARNVLLDDEDEETPIKATPTPVAAFQQSAPSPVVNKPAAPVAVPTPALKKSTSTTTMLKRSASAASSSSTGPKQQSLTSFFKPKQ